MLQDFFVSIFALWFSILEFSSFDDVLVHAHSQIFDFLLLQTFIIRKMSFLRLYLVDEEKFYHFSQSYSYQEEVKNKK